MEILHSYGLPNKIVSLIKLFYEKFECSILLDNSTTEWFSVESGVRQGCILSPILFTIAIDWVLRRTTEDKARGIQWTMFSKLEDLDFADDIALLSTNAPHCQEKVTRLLNWAKQTGLYINQKKTQVMQVNVKTPATTSIEGRVLADVDDFTYLGSVISNDNGAKKDIEARLGKARATFARLRTIWKSKQYSRRTKLMIYNSNVKSVLLYGSECWRVNQRDMARIDAFHNGCLRRILGIFWPNKISNIQLYERTGCQSVVNEIKKRRFRWLGHVFRMDQNQIPKVALNWTPPGKRKRGRPKTTWRRTIQTELEEMGLPMGQAQKIAQDRSKWRKTVDALCSSRNEEDK